MKIELTETECKYLIQYIREHGDHDKAKDLEFNYEYNQGVQMVFSSPAPYKNFVNYVYDLLCNSREFDEELFSIYAKIKRQEIVYEQSLRHTVNAKPLILGHEDAYQYIDALSRALTYSQHALTKHQINLIDTIIARISGQE